VIFSYYALNSTMIVKWLGHSCFLLKGDGEEGLAILMDPFNEEAVGYPLPHLEANIVTISHDHDDHNNVPAAGDYADVLIGEAQFISFGMDVFGIKSYHDSEKGRKRGENTIFFFELDGVRVCHLGDLGHKLSKSQIKEIGRVDLLFVPVGGGYTIDAAGADKVIDALHPAIAVPMHFQTAALNFPLAPLDDFLKGKQYTGPLEELDIRGEDLPAALALDEKTGAATRSTEIVLLSCPAAEGRGRSID